MENFGFDYLIERTQALHEMAKPNEFEKMGKENPAFSDFNKQVYLPLLKKMGEIGHLDKTKAAQKSIVYLTTILAGIPDHDGAYRDYVKNYVKKNLDSYQQWLGPKGSNTFQQDQFVLVQTVKKNIKKLANPDIISQIFDEGNIKNFAETNRISKISNFSKGMAKETENIFDMPIDQLHAIQAQAAPIIKKLNIAAAGRNRSINLKGNESRFAKKGIDTSTPIGVAQIAVKTFEDLLDDKRDIMAQAEAGRIPHESDFNYPLYKIPEEEFIRLMQLFQQRIDNGKGISEMEFYKILDPIINHSNKKIVAPYGLMVKDTFEGLMDDFSEGVEGGGRSEFGYDDDMIDDLLARGAITPEELQILKQWLPIQQKIKELRDMRKDSKGIRSSAEKFLQKGDSEESEETPVTEGVLNYMSEELWKKDILKTRGQFVDRGFKRVVNYNHWLNINQ